MSSRSRGFLRSLFGAGKASGPEPPLFPPPAPVSPDEARVARPPAMPPGIAIDPPRLERASPPPTPPEVPPAAAAPAPPPAAEPIALQAPARTPAARPTTLASALADAPLPPLARIAAAPARPAGDDVPQTFVERDLTEGAVAVAQPGFWGGQLPRLAVAPPAPPPDALPLLAGTEGFTNPFLINWHGQPRALPARDVPCFFATDAIVTGPGHIWLDGKLVTGPELMPGYVRATHNIPRDGERLLGVHGLKLRDIAAPCAVLVGHGLQVYGHFVIELLFRVLLVRRAMRGTGLKVRWLLDASAPAWLLRILHEDLGVAPEDIEFFRATEERVRLRQAILPGLVHRDEGFQPITNALVDDLLEGLSPLPSVPPAPRLFVARRGFRNEHSLPRECRNEAALVAMAEARGFVPIAAEELPWRQQLALFRDAETVLGLFGSALHTALVARPGTLVGCVGLLNTTQSEIAALRGHRMAYLTEGFALQGQFTVPEDAFARFLDVLSPIAPGQRPAAVAVAPAPAPVAPVAAGPVAPEEPGLDAVVIQRPGFGLARVGRYVVAPSVVPPPPRPLLPGTEAFALPAQRAMHREPRPAPPRDAACYFAREVVVSGTGLVWLGNARITASEVIPRLAAALPDPAELAAPTRTIEQPCIVVAGPGIHSHATTMLETLPRVLLAREALEDTGERLHVLLDSTAPQWLERMLRTEFNFKQKDLLRFAAPEERVLLQRAMLPTLPYRDGGFHPVLNELINHAVGRMQLPDAPVETQLFLIRPPVPGAAADAPRGECRNEPALLALAAAKYRFFPVSLDTLPMAERVARLRVASVIIAAHGVSPHTLLFAGDGVRVASIGARGGLNAEIGALRRQGIAYFSEGVPPRGPFTLPEDRFAAFLDALCDPSAEAAAQAA